MTESQRLIITHKKYLESALGLLRMAMESKYPYMAKSYLDHLKGFLEGGIEAMEVMNEEKGEEL